MTLKRETDWHRLQHDFSVYIQGDPLATRRLFEEIAKILKSFFTIRLNMHPEREDLLQATLLKIHFAREKFNPELSLKTWIFTIARNSLIDHWRGYDEARNSLSDSDEAFEVPSMGLEPSLQFELNSDLKKALNSLKPNDRTIVYLYAVEGFSMAEIAETLKMTETAVKVRAHRSYKEMRINL